jgi:hypothetical protein
MEEDGNRRRLLESTRSELPHGHFVSLGLRPLRGVENLSPGDLLTLGGHELIEACAGALSFQGEEMPLGMRVDAQT